MPDARDPLDVVGRVRHLEGVGIALDHPVDQVDLLGDGPRGVGMLAGDIDRPELGLDAPLAQPGDVGLARVEPPRQVELGEGEVPFGAQPPGKVVMAVEEHPRGVDLPRPVGDERKTVGFPLPVRVRWTLRPCHAAYDGQPGPDPDHATHPHDARSSRSHGAPVPGKSFSGRGPILLRIDRLDNDQAAQSGRHDSQGRVAGVHSL